MYRRVIIHDYLEDFLLESSVEVGVEEDLTIKTNDSKDFLDRVLESEEVQLFKIGLALVDESGLDVDEVVIVKFIHLPQQIEDNLGVILYLLKLRPYFVDFLAIIFTLYVVPSLLQSSLHLGRSLLYLFPRLLNTQIRNFLINRVTLIMQ